jgi:hypothetical protein
MNESILRAAGALHGQELDPVAMEGLIASLGRQAAQRTKLYAGAVPERQRAARGAAPIAPAVQTPTRRVANATAPLVPPKVARVQLPPKDRLPPPSRRCPATLSGRSRRCRRNTIARGKPSRRRDVAV